jgi:hypothetical protein
MRLTKRCASLLRIVRQARWLSTRQLHRRFFAHATTDAVSKRLRKLTQAGYLRCVREHPMAENLFTLGPAGKRFLEQEGSDEITLEVRLPKQIEHQSAINDLRISAELAAPLTYFFACWELASVGWKQDIIPDAIFALGDQVFAAEIDRDQESVAYFVRTKLKAYERGFEDLAVTALVIVADREARMRSLARALASMMEPRPLFSTVDMVRKHAITAPVFACGAGDLELISLL